MMSFILLVIVISVLVFVHELGHFAVAKYFGVRVDEFAIGFPPRLCSFKRGETVYAVNAIPFGGYVKIFGENPDADSMQGPDSDRSFVQKHRGIQAAILVAGIAMNILFAWVLLSASYMIGVREVSDDPRTATSVLISEVIPDSPAASAGLRAGDIITNASSLSIRESIATSDGKPVTLNFLRDGESSTAIIAPEHGIVEGRSAIGIAMVDVVDARYGFFRSLWEGAKSTMRLTIDTTKGIVAFLGSAFAFHADLQTVSGPVGIAGYLEQAREFGASTLFMFVALISINLAVVNLLPFPALDGGRLLLVAIESVTRRHIKPKIANALNGAGFLLLLALMAIVTISDIGKLMFR